MSVGSMEYHEVVLQVCMEELKVLIVNMVPQMTEYVQLVNYAVALVV